MFAGMSRMSDALMEARRRAGGLRAFGRLLGISGQAISQWRQAPAVRVLEIERLTGVSRHDLRPDIYPREDGRDRKGKRR
jgi:DNA-binding transcriptional regulator YdaS (Cro superfamily)